MSNKTKPDVYEELAKSLLEGAIAGVSAVAIAFLAGLASKDGK